MLFRNIPETFFLSCPNTPATPFIHPRDQGLERGGPGGWGKFITPETVPPGQCLGLDIWPLARALPTIRPENLRPFIRPIQTK